MSEKTEKATPKKRSDARKKGQVRRSIEVNNVATFFAMILIMNLFIGQTGSRIANFLRDGLLIEDFNQPIEVEQWLITYGLCVAPFFAAAFIVGIAISYLQVGFMFNTSGLKPDIKKINPLTGLKNMFSKKTLFTFIKTIIKLAIIGGIVFQTMKSIVPQMTQMVGINIFDGVKIMHKNLTSILVKVGIGLLVNALADYIFEWFDYENKLKMSKQEIKDEYKNREGDPQVKGQIRNKQLAMARMRMMQEVPTADAVITNPTHFAVAIKYEQGKDKAPVVVAKGQNKVAQKIKSIATEHDVVIVENKPLARALYRKVDIGDYVPYDMFKAVAEVLAYVYKVKKKLH